MPALALRDQPLDCSMRLRDLPAWPPPAARPLHQDRHHGQYSMHRLRFFGSLFRTEW